jgi:hypothetical protein
VSAISQNDHAFLIETDIVQLNDVEDRLQIEGYIGKITEISFAKDFLEIKGLEGTLKIKLNKKEIQKLLFTDTQLRERL